MIVNTRRLFNVLIACILLLLFAIPMVIIAILIKATSRGPVLYIQERVGYKGRIFRIYKFRSMYDGLYADSPHVDVRLRKTGEYWAIPSDPRITPIGGFLRKTRLDELPQFINVLLGHMNVVGPRPEQPRTAEYLSTTLEGYDQRHETLPGITGLAQITLPADKRISDVRAKLVIDQEYIKSQSVLTDLKIMFKTPGIMFRI
jgi:lipopolysaccharide/colanic/teichoic acid biosynthesis glycosyltransferase